MSASARWSAFLDKVTSRVTELETEARAGLEGLVETEVLDPVPLSQALSELRARFQGLTKKVDDAWEGTIEPLLADATEAEWNRLWQQGEVLRRRIEATADRLEVEANALHARALHRLVEEEATQPPACASCGAPLSSRVRPRAVNVTCAHCKSVTTVRPGVATAMFFGGGALHALGLAGAAEAFRALATEERRFTAFVHPTSEDLERYREALTTAWTAWAKAKRPWVPGATEAMAQQEAAVKVSQAITPIEQRESARRQARSDALRLARAGNVAGLVSFLRGAGAKQGLDAEAMLECAAEHQGQPALEAALKAAVRLEVPDDAGAWVAEKRAEVLQTVRRRRR